tara:strand:+ start:289 stop:495 length:207 start_codon:yes stop_codon:yes gene_type:complete
MSILRKVIEDKEDVTVTFNTSELGLFMSLTFYDDDIYSERSVIINNIEALEELKKEINKTIKELKKPF